MINVKVFENAPKAAGVYIFKKAGTPLYIGKAANLKKRLSSYWRKNAASKIQNMLREAIRIEWIETGSEIEALLKEAELIKKYQPKYNYLLRDDKNYFYVGITREMFPKVFITHQPYQVKSLRLKVKSYIGPFTSGAALKETLRLLRRVFPYCTCRTPHKRPCLNAQIGRCPGFCCLKRGPTRIETRTNADRYDYQRNMKSIITVLNGKKPRILLMHKREMRRAVKKQDFERAAKLRNQVGSLENIFEHRFSWKNSPKAQFPNWKRIEDTLKMTLETKKTISRVEGYDISNISGTEATGSMVVFIDGKPAKSEYRKFKIKNVRGANDVAMLKEVILRRLAHDEWKYPDLVLMDGGKAQLNAVMSRVRPYNIVGSDPTRRIQLAALAKREEELYTEGRKHPIRLHTLPRDTAFFLQRVRDESHRFAKKYHHKLREKLYRDE